VAAAGLEVRPVDACFGAIVTDVDLRRIDDTTWHTIHEAWIEYALLIFPGQFLARDEQDAFARHFGDLEFGAAPITNLDKDGNVHSEADDDRVKSIRGNEGWHHDSTYMPVQARGAVVTAEIVPSAGAATGFADMRAAYEALDDDTRAALDGRTAKHSLYYSQGRSGYLPTPNADGGYDMYGYHDGPVPVRPLTKVHPDTGRVNLLAGRHAHEITGLDAAESEAFLDRLDEEACHPSRCWFHQWELGDAVLWDNRRLMHCATPFDLTEPRRIWHTRIAGDPATETALNYR
jgi:alpha-ketoglutarate-dependent taurine dioxygenase